MTLAMRTRRSTTATIRIRILTMGDVSNMDLLSLLAKKKKKKGRRYSDVRWQTLRLEMLGVALSWL